MSGKKKHRNLDPKALRDYLADRMSGEERNAFEKELQKDPFAGEALEGLTSLPEEEVYNDLEELQSRWHESRTDHHHRIVLYRVAAVIAGLILVTSAYLVFDHKISELRSERMARIENAGKKTPPDREKAIPPIASNDEEIVAADDSNRDKNVKPSGDVQAKQELPGQPREEKTLEIQEQPEISSEAVPEEAIVTARSESPELSETIDKPEIVPGIALNEPSFTKEKAAPQTRLPDRNIASAKRAAMPTSVSGKIISAEDSSPIPGATVMIKGTTKGTVTDVDGKYNLAVPASDTTVTLVASMIGMESREKQTGPGSDVNLDLEPGVLSMDEVVVTGYGTKKKADVTGAVTVIHSEEDKPAYTPPKPVGGFDAFDNYLEKNRVFPSGHPDRDKATVVLKFSVDEDNRPAGIKVVKSPGNDFSDEAIRLIKNGPDWSRAIMRDSVIDAEVRIIIVLTK
ncbi:MAG TPA: carboxypeptidase-like regulatory domain-containing protein [Bacteroidales bacterium]|nr:carboxypeptidase-like regulatory domain-containing protein [Bacteroidales bacterium]